MHVCVCENIYVFKLFFISFARELSVTLVVLKDQGHVDIFESSKLEGSYVGDLP